jgi:hypothetical protein
VKAARVVRAGGRWKRTRNSGHLASGRPVPVFQVPAGTIAHHGDPAALTRQMRQIQTAVAYQGHRETPRDAPA